MNEAGVRMFMRYRPFDKLFTVLLSHKYLHAMKRKRPAANIHSSSHHPELSVLRTHAQAYAHAVMGDTPSALGTAIAELMRHQQPMRLPAINAVVELLDRLNGICNDAVDLAPSLPNDTKYVRRTEYICFECSAKRRHRNKLRLALCTIRWLFSTQCSVLCMRDMHVMMPELKYLNYSSSAVASIIWQSC
jgi:hypothetical protein